MSTRPLPAALSISVDLEPDHVGSSVSEQRALDEVSLSLVELFARHRLPATWSVADPAVSAIRPRIEAPHVGHELAILGDASWVGGAAGRSRFARELVRRVMHARSEGLEVATLALRVELPLEHADLAIKEGILAIRQPLNSSERAVQKVRFGLWGFSAHAALPGTSRWLPGGGGLRAAKLAIDRAIADRVQTHLALDAAVLAERGSSSLRIVERVLAHAARRRDASLLQVLTLGAIARRLAGDNVAQQPTRSILRPAA
jgi:hypothetical protein